MVPVKRLHPLMASFETALYLKLGSPIAPSCFPAQGVDRIPGEETAPSVAMGKFSPTRLKADCEEATHLSTAYGRRRCNWIDAHGSVPAGQVVDASGGNRNCIALRHAYLRPSVGCAARIHRLKVGRHFDVRGVGTANRSRNRFRSGLYAAARLDRVSVRGQPDGGVRVAKVGVWSSLRT